MNAFLTSIAGALITAISLWFSAPYPVDRTRYEVEISSPTELKQYYKKERANLREAKLCSKKNRRYCRNESPYPFGANLKGEGFPVLAFAPLKEIRRDKAFSDFEKRIGTTEPIECNESQCSFARFGFDPRFRNLEVVLTCSYLKILGTSGKRQYLAPRCQPVMIKDGPESGWALAVLGYFELPHPFVGETGEVGSFPVALVGHLPSQETVASVVSEALVKPVLSLTPANTPVQHRFVAGVAGRNSPVIPPFREQSKVEVAIVEDSGGDNRPAFIGFWIDLTLYVNRYNTDDPNDWHLPTSVQSEKYKNAVRDALYERLKSACQGQPDKTVGPFVLRCQ